MHGGAEQHLATWMCTGPVNDDSLGLVYLSKINL